MRMNGLLAIFAFATCLAASAEEPTDGKIVIRPKNGSTPSIKSAPEVIPDKDGFLVIRPLRYGSPAATMPTPRQLDSDNGKGSKPIKPAIGSSLDPVPVSDPKPVTDGTAPKPAANAKGDAEKGKIVLETWDVAYLKGQKIGYFHVIVREHEHDGKKYVYATKMFRMNVSRFGQPVEQWTEDATMETMEGTVLTVRMRYEVGKNQTLSITGKVDGRTLIVKGEGAAAAAESVPWPEGVLGVAKEATLFADRKPKPGESFEYSVYEGRLNQAIKTTVTAKAIETVALIQGEKPRKLLRLEAVMQELKDKQGRVVFKMPPGTIWCDPDTFEMVRMDQDMAALGGRITYMRTTKDVALRPATKLVEIFDAQSIVLARPVPNLHEAASAVYRITMESEAEPESAIPQDGRQIIQNIDKAKKTFDLQVSAIRGIQKLAVAEKVPGPEYLSHSFFIDWQDDRVKAHAKAAVAGLPAGATPWQQAKAVETWVFKNMRGVEFSQAQASASEVAKTLNGDCTEFGVLAAGMCRALGISSRTVYGLVYATDRSGKAFLAYHMWYEVYAEGQWLALDGTRGQGSIGPGHIKITDTSWDNEKSLAPVLPLIRVLMAKPAVEIVKVNER